MSNEKRVPTPEQVAALLRDANRMLVADKGQFSEKTEGHRMINRLADALEAQAAQLKQAREQLAAAEYVIAAADSHIAHDFERRTHLEEVLMAYRECYPLEANPAPATEDER